jgi:TPP-dependent pyruvate/acetoin dehydrogenase alpha subunit
LKREKRNNGFIKKGCDLVLKDNQYPREMLLKLLENMERVRKFETKIADCYAKAMVSGMIHTCIEQEAVSVGACAALEPMDYITRNPSGPQSMY